MDTPNSDIGVGTSDKALFIVSLVGFILIGSTLYLLLPKTKPVAPPPNPANQVGNQNRAQRRANARHRRQDPHNVAEDIGIEDAAAAAAAADAAVNVDNNDNEEPNEEVEIHMTRKERLKATKRAEKEERRRMEEHRREELRQRKEAEEAAYYERKEHEREKEEERRKKEDNDKKRLELGQKKEYEKWKRSFVLEGSGYEHPNIEEEWRDFINFIQERKFVSLHLLEKTFQLTRRDVMYRITKLEKQKILMGILNEKGDYVCFSDTELKKIVDYVKLKGCITSNDLAMEMKNVISA